MPNKPSAHVVRALSALHVRDTPAQTFNPGVSRKLLDEGWADQVYGPAINQRAKPGEQISYLRLTQSGREAYAKFRG
jgi:hypothetical protein